MTEEVTAMHVRLTALASLAGQIGSMTVSMGGMLVRARVRREPATVYEDHF